MLRAMVSTFSTLVKVFACLGEECRIDACCGHGNHDITRNTHPKVVDYVLEHADASKEMDFDLKTYDAVIDVLEKVSDSVMLEWQLVSLHLCVQDVSVGVALKECAYPSFPHQYISIIDHHHLIHTFSHSEISRDFRHNGHEIPCTMVRISEIFSC
jgi:hypothetical protein